MLLTSLWLPKDDQFFEQNSYLSGSHVAGMKKEGNPSSSSPPSSQYAKYDKLVVSL
jgi:hypothetical protein